MLNASVLTSPARRPGRPARRLPDLGDLPVPGRRAVLALLRRNRRALDQHGTAVCGDEWTAGLLAGLYAAGALRSRAEVVRVARLVSDDLIAIAVARPRLQTRPTATRHPRPRRRPTAA